MSFVCVYILKTKKQKQKQKFKKIQKKFQDFQIFPKKREIFSNEKSHWTRGIEPLSHFQNILKKKKSLNYGHWTY